MHYAIHVLIFSADKYNDSTGQVDQTVSVNGNVGSTLSTCMYSRHSHFSLSCPTDCVVASGKGGLGWGTAMECQQENCGTVPEHHYIDTQLTMSAANPNYKNTLCLNGSSGDLVTSDGGFTWTVSDIKINQYTYT